MRASRVLLVEDSAADAELVAVMLKDGGSEIVLTHATTVAGAIALLATDRFEAALVDLSLPDAHGLEAVARLRDVAPELPLVVLTGASDDRTASAALGVGAQDYLDKDGLTGALIERALRFARERLRAERAERAALRSTSALLDALESPTCAVDADGVVSAVNQAVQAVDAGPLRCAEGDHLPSTWEQSSHLGLAGALREVLDGVSARAELECRGADERWWSLRITPTAPAGAVVMQVDVTAMKQAQERLSAAVLHDPLTGLANRALLQDRLEQKAAHAERDGRVLAVLFLDVDRFKAVNDTLGHAAGDEVLRTVADRLTAQSRRADTVARVSGDEFVVAWLDDDEAHARIVAERLVDAVNAPTLADGRWWALAVSAGLASAKGLSVEDLLQLADEAMYVVKARGGGQLEVATPQLRAALARRQQVESELGAALVEDRLEVHYQPVVRLADGVPCGVEALVRLRGTDGRLVPPGEFIEVAERSGIIVALGGAVLGRACREAQSWTGELADLTVAVNLSTRQLAQPDVVDTVRSALQASGLDPARLVLEVTESAVVEDAESALQALTALKQLGVRIAIDDFGTGYSSFLYLKRFPVDILKIDRSFVAGMLESPDDAAIVASIVRLGQDVGLVLVAEGVETQEQRAELVRLGCAEAQGYLFARPVPPEELPAALDACTVHPELEAAPAERRPAVPRQVPPLDPRHVPPAVLERIGDLSSDGASLHTIAAVLNADGLRTPSGRRWHARTVAHCLPVRAAARQWT